jgi:hypothetical protein
MDKSILICALLAIAVLVGSGNTQAQVASRDFDGDGQITPTDYVDELISLYGNRTTPGAQVVDFDLVDLKGKLHTAVQYRGQVLLLWFMGYDCTGCLNSAPHFEETVQQRNKGNDFQILGMDIWNGTAAQLATFQFTTGVSMPMLQKAGNPEFPFGADVSSVAVVDRDGVVRGVYGEADDIAINRMVDLVLAQAPLANYTPTALYFGLKTEVGDPRQLTIKIKNDGAVDLNVTNLRSSMPELVLDQTELTIPPASTGEVKAVFTPTMEGTLSGEVTMSTNDPDRRTIVIPLDDILVEGGLPGVVAITETNLVLGEFDLDRSGASSFTIRNDGQGPLQVTGLESDLAGITFSETALTLQAGESTTVAITVNSTVEGPFSGTVNVLSNDPAQASLSIPVSGTAIVVPADARVDFDGSNTVDFNDFLLFVAAFGTTNATFDVSGNGVVDFNDFLTFSANFGKQVN